MKLHPFKLERYFARWEFAVPYTMGSSDCETVAIRDLLDLEPDALERLLNLRLGYTESQGHPALRDAISKLYETIAPGQVVVHAGAEEAIYNFMIARLAPGDHAIVQIPCYQSLLEVARGAGAEVSGWRGDPDCGWQMDPDRLKQLVRPHTKLLVINTPHNPTGYHFPDADFRGVFEIAARHGLTVLCDEVYRESEHDPACRLPAACDLYDDAVSLGVMSKSYGLAGLRIGWAASRNPAWLERMMELKDYTTICNSAPAELLAEIALRHRQLLAGRTRAIIRHNLDLLDEFFGRHAGRFRWQRPVAGPVAFPRLTAGDIEDFCTRLATGAGVLLIPGTLFDEPAPHFRIGFGRANLPQALERLDAWLASQ